MVSRIGHDRSMRIVTPGDTIARMWPSAFIFLGQDVSPMHSVFLEMTRHIVPRQAFDFHKVEYARRYGLVHA